MIGSSGREDFTDTDSVVAEVAEKFQERFGGRVWQLHTQATSSAGSVVFGGTEMNTDTAGLHDPQSADRRFLRDRMNDLLNEPLHPCQGGMWMTQYDETRGMLRRKIQELGEVKIYGDQAPLFSLAGCGVILSTLQIFIEDRAHGVPGPNERRLPAGITIFVELELALSGRDFDREHPFAGHFGGIRETGPDIFSRETRISSQHLFDTIPIGKVLDDEPDHDASPLHARLTMTDAGIDADAVKEIFYRRPNDRPCTRVGQRAASERTDALMLSVESRGPARASLAFVGFA